MESILKIFGAAVLVILGILVLPLLGVLGGIFSGWVVGIFFTDMILEVLSRFGVDTVNIALWQIGGALGFIGGFIKSYQTNNNTK